ncbi:IucA/IucC family siderophore biosynthesis protein [uncultured Anoxybacillus sp.]|uniref:IucA/IucC family protein n=1 Tax=uncultured Anoxybacillus sp. TaxID=263860 RepID=UPI00261305F6|nr:IucA/IucC family protein [uncultured Anoxybacillus sp.]
MSKSSKQIAEQATLQAFLNSYLREADAGTWLDREEWRKRNKVDTIPDSMHMLELTLPSQNVRLAVEVKYKSVVGRHTFGCIWKYVPFKKGWKVEHALSAILMLIQELNAQEGHSSSSEYDELLFRLIDSYRTMSRYIEKRQDDGECLYVAQNRFIENEQSLLFGHWFHPTPKSRQGMLEWHQEQFSPELQGAFKLHYFKVKRGLVREESVAAKPASELIKESLIKQQSIIPTKDDEVLIPVHPLQAQWLLQQTNVQEKIEEGVLESVGLLGSPYAPTSSIRTVYHPEVDWMYKFSIPVKVTNSLRVNRLHELKAGVAMARLMKKVNFFQKYPSFRIIQDPAYVTVDLGDGKESGFEVIIRSNCFKSGKDEGITSIAAFVQDPLPTFESRLKRLVCELANKECTTIEVVSARWFQQYFFCAVIPLIRLYDEYGIALEAHQQNSVLDISAGYPTAYYFRDNQGYYLSAFHKESLLSIEPSLVETPELFYDECIIQERFTYYLCLNQLFSVIHRFGADGLIREETLVEWVIHQLRRLESELKGLGKRFVQYLLYEQHIRCKANLLTCFHGVDELMSRFEQAVYTEIRNPLVATLWKEEEQYEPVQTSSH